MTTEFPLGVYVGYPNGSNAASEAAFEKNYSQFTAVMGAQAQFYNAYIDQSQPISDWVGNAGWLSWSAQQSPVTQHLIPVIALPMTSTADGSPAADQSYKNFASGTYDAVLKGLVQTWADHGYTTQDWRPGWEFNESNMPSYAGSDPATQADWVLAFQHISTVLHAAAVADGVTLKVAWNPNETNYSNAEAITSLYPGNQYVDEIGVDIFGDLHPYGNLAALYDWDKSGQVLNSSHAVFTPYQQWARDPINLQHFYQYPASTQWALDGSVGHSLSLQDLLDFAKANGKPFVIPETGAGGTVDGANVSDNPTFVQWLGTTLKASGVPVDYVNLWDFNNGDNDIFTDPANPKPLEEGAWIKYFGPTFPAVVTLGSGASTIDLKMSEQAYYGNALFTVSVDGIPQGGAQTAFASHGSGEDQDFVLHGNWGAGTHHVAVDFLNDAFGGSASADRNLYVDGLSYNGSQVAGGTLFLGQGGTQILSVGTPVKSVTILGTGADTIDLGMSEDAYRGDALFTVSVDGVQVGGTQTATAIHAGGQDQDFLIEGNFGAGQHEVSVDFLNDAWGGSAWLDRNLYVDSASFDGIGVNATLALHATGTQSLAAGAPDILAVTVSEDALDGDAMFTVSVDGAPLGGTLTATASHAAGQSQVFDIGGSWGAGKHSVAISFLNATTGETGSQHRTLYVSGATLDGVAQKKAVFTLQKSTTKTFSIVSTSTGDGSLPALADWTAGTITNVLTTVGSAAAASRDETAQLPTSLVGHDAFAHESGVGLYLLSPHVHLTA